jgi:exodeoxyribonuclease-3
VKPLSVQQDIGIEEHDQEGRVLCLEYEHFYLVNVYVPNSGNDLKRLKLSPRVGFSFFRLFEKSGKNQAGSGLW